MDNLKEDFVEVRVAIMAVQCKLDFVEKMPSFFSTSFYLFLFNRNEMQM